MPSDSVSSIYKGFVKKKMLLALGLFLSLILLAGASATLGSSGLTLVDVYIAVLARIAPGHFQTSWLGEMVVWELRLPPIFMGILAGMGLAVSGAAMQGILRNPLASPFTLGISSAASFGAALAIILGAGLVGGEYLIVLNAFVFSLIAAAAVFVLAEIKGITSESMVLAGIAIMYFFSALTSVLQYVGRSEDVHALVFWTMGSLGRSTWHSVCLVFVVVASCLPWLIWKSWDINALESGEETATSLGVDINQTRMATMTVASLITASIISFTGTIGFIGLVAPHMARIIIGGDNRFLLMTSALMGALLLLGADAVGRTAFAPAVLPVGLMTSLLGVPLFVYLFMKRRKKSC
ncbi:MAG: iron ABC transporter permease [Methanothrix sp.]|nr:iron ABC transporter permease [Methanothrix sp.]